MNKEQKYISIFLAGWTILNLIQSCFLDINTDEAYYHFYSTHLQWGYFDHPPVVAFLIKVGYWLLPNQVGVRLPFAIMSSLSIYLIWKIMEGIPTKLFLRIIVSIAAVHVMGFHALPEIPLVFFSLVFLFLLKKYLADDKIYLAILISITLALIMLTKYYGVFIPMATLVGAPFLLKRKSCWLIILLTLVFLVPHILWQIQNDFISIKFHLYERHFGYVHTFQDTLTYIIYQPLIAGPIIGFTLFYLAIKYQTQNSFDRVLKALLFIVFGFFLFVSLRGKVLHLWTSVGIIPLIILALKELVKNPGFVVKYRKFLNVSFIISVVLFILARLLLLYDFIPHSKVKYDYTHGFKNWAHNIETLAQGCPVVFVGTLEETSRYMFYSKQYAHCLASLYYKRSYFDFSDEHRKIFNKRVLILGQGDSVFNAGNNKKYAYRFYDHFASYPGIQISTAKMKYSVSKKDTVLTLPVKITRNPYRDDELGICRSNLHYAVFSENGTLLVQKDLPIEIPQLLSAKEGIPIEIEIPEGKEKIYLLRLGFRSGTLPVTLNSGTITLKRR